MNRFPDLRSYLDALRDAGELAEISREVDWDLEMGAIARRCYEKGAPAPLFTNVKDSLGFRALSAPMGESAIPGQRFARIALSLGLPSTSGAREIIDRIAAARRADLIKPVITDSGPCKQNLRLGDGVDILKLPIPIIHNHDGGRYLNTLGTIVCRTVDGTWTSWSIARIMALDARRAAGIVMPFQHIGKVFATWRKARKDMPVAIAFGPEPIATYTSAMPLPELASEVDFAGALAGEPIETIRCETIDLEVPASAEIVLEGHLSVTDVDIEGPFAEEAGYTFPDFGIPQPVYHFEAITYRDNAIYPFTCSGEPADEDHTVWGVGLAAEAAHMLRAAGLPVTVAWSPFETSCGWLVVTVNDAWRDIESDAESSAAESATSSARPRSVTSSRPSWCSRMTSILRTCAN